ncbi:hypothetical protein OZN62_08115 [Aurantiacibacter sp. MUD11]|uniref:hypothetical protein n=1 Tax=Aurantiacibacter sp. MUD11 TaxID=3003265 RepID=UPI0022AA1683|nr:hypothetical protein [Aurantiacibacter sp. MUD11]WAT16904.1 hypothetical protein OZN62_08115 [Aurantiacibacter sp. MUD11]
MDSELIPNKLDKLVTALQQNAEATNESTQLRVAELRDGLFESLDRSRFNNYPPSLDAILEEMGVKAWLGQNLRRKLEAAFVGNEVTPAAVKAKVAEIRDTVKRIWADAEQLGISAARFNIERDKNAFNEYDFAIIIPRSFVSNELDDFGAELKRLDRIFSVFNEIATGSREDFKIKSISSTDFSIILESAPATALVIATALERLAAFYERVLNIIVLQRQVLGEDRMPEAVKKGFEEHVESEKQIGIQEIVEELEKEFFNKKNEGRRNELRNELRANLTEIARRFDSGFLFDVRGGEPEESDPEDENAKKPKAIDLKRYERIKAARERIRLFKGQSRPALQLTKPEDEGSD